MSLQIDYRPDSFDEVYGNETTIESLQEYIKGIKDGTKQGRSIMITGPSGCAKTTLARIVGKELGAYDPEKDSPNFLELNASDDKGIGTVRAIKKQMIYAPMSGDFRVFFLDECHKLSADAQEAFLKPLEEPPAHVIFILCTTNPEKLKPTLKRRCATFEVTGLTEDTLMELLTDTVEAEEKEVPKKVLEIIAETSAGSPGIALGALDVIIDLPQSKMESKAKQAAVQQSQAIELCRLIFKGANWKQVSKVLTNLKNQGEEPESIRRMILGYCSSILLKGDNPKAYLVMDCFREPTYNNGFPGLILSAYEAVTDGG